MRIKNRVRRITNALVVTVNVAVIAFMFWIAFAPFKDWIGTLHRFYREH